MASSMFLCSTCAVAFEQDIARRQHMREEWHVYNIKRKMAALPPISTETYRTSVSPPRAAAKGEVLSRDVAMESVENDIDALKAEGDDDDDEEEIILPPPPESCLFCPTTSDSVGENVAHMKSSHGFHIPNLEGLQTDVETLISYAALVVSRYCSCLYCGQVKASDEAVRAHMLDKGHCMLDVEPESEFLEFWEGGADEEDDDGEKREETKMLSDTEMILLSGATASNRHHRPPRLRRPKAHASSSSDLVLATTEGRAAAESTQDETPPSNAPTQTLARRDQMGVIGLSDQQKRSLITVRNKMRAREQRHASAGHWRRERVRNKQKFYEPDMPIAGAKKWMHMF